MELFCFLISFVLQNYNTMLRSFAFSILLLSFISFVSCGPAAEDRNQMHARAKVISDSMANLIRSAMAEAEMPPQANVPKPVDSSAIKAAQGQTAAAAQTVAPNKSPYTKSK
jgi:hypothetical protein